MLGQNVNATGTVFLTLEAFTVVVRSICHGNANDPELAIIHRFLGDKLGISAYKRGEDGISPGTFTRFDQHGLYGIKE